MKHFSQEHAHSYGSGNGYGNGAFSSGGNGAFSSGGNGGSQPTTSYGAIVDSAGWGGGMGMGDADCPTGR